MNRDDTIHVRNAVPWYVHAALLCWLVIVGIGLFLLLRYSMAAEEISDETPRPMSARSEKTQLQVFLHPKCSCSSATVSELARLHQPQSLDFGMTFHVFCPGKQSDDWIESSLLTQVRRIPNTTVCIDRDGAFAMAQGVTTSGHVFVFAKDGTCLFSDGVTSSRGHEGENIGIQAVRSAIRSRRAQDVAPPVFGCRIIQSLAKDTRNEQRI